MAASSRRRPRCRQRRDLGQAQRPDQLGDPDARVRCLARFAHHELMAVELFAWALLRWPALDERLRRGWLGVLADEQRHCSMYLERLRAHGRELGAEDCSDYFWKHSAAIAESPHGPRAFLAAMGLTLEQANLDFAGLYADAFERAGDLESAGVCRSVHADEIGHVRLADRWLALLSPDGQDAIERYAESVPFPLGPGRAKGRRFDRASREAAGLERDFIDWVRDAGPQTLRRTRGA